jgi:DNA-directed RNA polymerase specialized sigma24 family protein
MNRLPVYRKDFVLLANAHDCKYRPLRETFKLDDYCEWPRTRLEAYETEIGYSWTDTAAIRATLDSREKDLLEMMVINLKKQEDIAAILGVNQSTISQAYRRILDKIKFRLNRPPLPEPRRIHINDQWIECNVCKQIITLMDLGHTKQVDLCKMLGCTQGSISQHMSHMRKKWNQKYLYMTYKVTSVGRPKDKNIYTATHLIGDTHGNIHANVQDQEPLRPGVQQDRQACEATSCQDRQESV